MTWTVWYDVPSYGLRDYGTYASRERAMRVARALQADGLCVHITQDNGDPV